MLIFGGGQFVEAGVLEAAWLEAAWLVPEAVADDVFPDCGEFPDDAAVPDAEVPAEFPVACVGLQSGGTTFFLSRERCTVDRATPAGFCVGVEFDGDGGAD
jgi:hypothetical protein